MEIAPKALYNSLRISFLQNPFFGVEQWKIEDYRSLTLDELFLRVSKYSIVFDPASFIAYANEYDSPEELFDDLVADQELNPEKSDPIYLLIFELWRRLVPEKLSISIVCDELDYQIFVYDTQGLTNSEPLEDALSSFLGVLIENVDNGIAPTDAYDGISDYLANDLQSFLVDYISELIEEKDFDHASELLEQFYAYMPDKKWFELLQARLIGAQDISQGHVLLSILFHKAKAQNDVEFNFDILSYLVGLPDKELFCQVATHSLSLLADESEFEELLTLASEFFFDRNDHEKVKLLEGIVNKRKKASRCGTLLPEDPDLALVKKCLTRG